MAGGGFQRYTAPFVEHMDCLVNALQFLMEECQQGQQRMNDWVAQLTQKGNAHPFIGTAANTLVANHQELETLFTSRLQLLDQFIAVLNACVRQVNTANDSAEAQGLNDDVVYAVLADLPLDEVLRYGEAPVQNLLQHETLLKGIGDILHYTPSLWHKVVGVVDYTQEELHHELARVFLPWSQEIQQAGQIFLNELAPLTSSFQTLQGGSAGKPGFTAQIQHMRQSLNQYSSANQIARLALQWATYLKPYKGVYSSLDLASLTSIPADQRNLVAAILAQDTVDWGLGINGAPTSYGSYHYKGDIECIAFVAMILGLARNDSSRSVLPVPLNRVGKANNAVNLWPQNDANTPPGWERILNGQSLPQPGDVIVMADGGPGHVAIVTGIEYNASGQPIKVWFAQANASQPEDSFPINGQTVRPTWSGYSVLGFLRPVSPPL
jgi:hypothetical protein